MTTNYSTGAAVTQFNSYFFACKVNSPEENYKVSTSKKKETTQKLKSSTNDNEQTLKPVQSL